MKKQLFTLLSALSLGTLSAQTPSPSWSIAQNANFPFTIAGHSYMDAINSNVAWVSGFDGQAGNLNYNYVSVTSNGGTNWTSNTVFPDTNSWSISNMEGVDANNAWVAAYNKATGGGGSIWTTTNGGATWNNVTATGMFTNTAAFGNWITWINPTTAIVNGDPVNGEFELWRTTNSASSWALVAGSNIPDPISGEYAVVDLYSTFGPSHVWFGTNRGRVYRSSDAGATWSVSSVIAPGTGTVLEVDFASATHGLVYIVSGSAPSALYELYNTTDGGVTWSKIPGANTPINGGVLDVPANFGLNEMQPVPGTNWFVSAGNSTISLLGLSYSKDNGVTWTPWNSSQIGYNTVDMADRFTGWAGGYAYSTSSASDVLHKYSGNTFNAQFSIPGAICLTGSSVTVTPVNNSGAGTNTFTQQWSSSPSAQFSSASASVPVITFTAAGSYTVSLTITDPNGTNTMTQVIAVANCQAPVASFSLNTSSICNNQSINVTNTSTGGPPPTVTVSVNPNTNVSVSAFSNNQAAVFFQDAGTYTVTMMASSISGTSSTSQVVTILECRPDVTFTMQDTACRTQPNVPITPVINGTAAVQNFTWSYSPNNAGIVAFPPTNTLVPPSKNLVLNTNAATNQFTTYVITLATSNQYGTRSYSKVLIVTPDDCPTDVGVSENGWTSAIRVYPNPAHDNLNISVPASAAGYNVKVYNVLGAVVHNEKLNASGNVTFSLDLGAYRKGVYFAEISSQGETVTRKFIVE